MRRADSSTYLEKACCHDNDQECFCQLLDFVVQGHVYLTSAGADARRSLENVHNQQPMLRQESPALQHVVGSATDNRRPDDACHFDE